MPRSLLHDSIAGLLAAAVALAAGELAAGLAGATSLIVAVADRIVDLAPGWFIRFGIELFGTNDKPALLVSIVLVSLGLGAAIGPLAGRFWPIGAAALAGFGLVGVLAEAGDPLGSTGAAIVVGGSAALAGGVALYLLLQAAGQVAWDGAPSGAGPSRTTAGITLPGRATGSRRRFISLAAATAAAAPLTAIAGRNLVPTVDVEAERAGIVLPEPANSVASVPGLDVEDISPLITPNDEFYRIDTAFVVPRVEVSGWSLAVTGMVARPFQVSFDELLAMPAVEESITLACVSNYVGGDLVGNAIWRGVPLPDLLARAGLDPAATQIVGRSVDDFTVGFPTEAALDGRAALVAYAMNGEPLPAEHGFPARLVVAGLYGYVSATKWLSEIELTTLEAFDAYWVPCGWSKEAPIKTQSRIDTPAGRQERPAGRVPIGGVAWGGIRGISRVEVRVTPVGTDVSQGTWHEARLGDAMSQSSWRQWVVESWEPGPGEYYLHVRATDGEGTPQTEQPQLPAPNGATGLHRVRVRVV